MALNSKQARAHLQAHLHRQNSTSDMPMRKICPQSKQLHFIFQRTEVTAGRTLGMEQAARGHQEIFLAN
jgi:hypothetical protein